MYQTSDRQLNDISTVCIPADCVMICKLLAQSHTGTDYGYSGNLFINTVIVSVLKINNFARLL
jgi:hypothetical protein